MAKDTTHAEERALSLKWNPKDAALYANSIGIGGSGGLAQTAGSKGVGVTSVPEEQKKESGGETGEWQRKFELPFVYVAGSPTPRSAYPTTPLGLMFRATVPHGGGSPPNGQKEGEKPFVIWEDPLLTALVEFDALKLLHGTQSIRWHLGQPQTENGREGEGAASMPANLPEGVLTHRLVALDVKKNAVVSFTESRLYVDRSRKILLCTMLSSMFLRGGKLRGGATNEVAALQKHLSSREALTKLGRRWGALMSFGDEQQVASTKSTSKDAPGSTTRGQVQGAPSTTVRGSFQYRLADNQGSLYRLNGDTNPIHIDPVAARSVGLSQPIVHGLCTFGYASRALLQHCHRLQPHQSGTKEGLVLAGMNGKFVAPVLDGDRIEVVVECPAPKNSSSNDSRSVVVASYQVFAYSGNDSADRSSTMKRRLVLRGVGEYESPSAAASRPKENRNFSTSKL